MYERFDDKAIESVLYAQEQACRLGHASVDSEHLLLGLAEARGGAASLALESFGMSLGVLKNKISEDIECKTMIIPNSLDLPLSECSKRVVGLAWSSAQVLKQHSIGTHDLMAGLIDEPDCRAANTLSQLGIDLTELRKRAITMAAEQTSLPSCFTRGRDSFWDTVDIKSMGEFLLVLIERGVSGLRGSDGYLRDLSDLCPVLGLSLKVSRVFLAYRNNVEPDLKYREWRASNTLTSCRELRWPEEDSAILKMILATKEPVLITGSDIKYIDLNVHSELKLLGAQFLLGIQFRHEEKSYGYLVLQQSEQPHGWDSERLRWLQRLSDLLGDYMAKKT